MIFSQSRIIVKWVLHYFLGLTSSCFCASDALLSGLSCGDSPWLAQLSLLHCGGRQALWSGRPFCRSSAAPRSALLRRGLRLFGQGTGRGGGPRFPLQGLFPCLRPLRRGLFRAGLLPAFIIALGFFPRALARFSLLRAAAVERQPAEPCSGQWRLPAAANALRVCPVEHAPLLRERTRPLRLMALCPHADLR